MISPWVGQVALGAYAVLLAVGGTMGFVKKGSKASLIAGLVSAGLAVVALWVTTLGGSGFGHGFVFGMLLASGLLGMFGVRFAAQGRKFMPNGLMAVVSLVVLGVLVGVSR